MKMVQEMKLKALVDGSEEQRKTDSLIGCAFDVGENLINDDQWQCKLFLWGQFNEGKITLKEMNDDFGAEYLADKEIREKPKVLVVGPAKPPISEIAKHLIEKADLVMMEPDKIHAPLGQIPGYEAASIFSLNMGMTMQYKARPRLNLNSYSVATGPPANLINRDRKKDKATMKRRAKKKAARRRK